MSYREIIDPDGKIDQAYLPDDGIPPLGVRQLLGGDGAGNYVPVGATPGSVGNVLATVPITPSNPTGLAFQPGASISLTRGQLITSTGSGTTALQWAGNDPANQGDVLSIDVGEATGLKYVSLNNLFQAVFPMVIAPGETFGLPPGTVRLDIGYTAGAQGQGQIPMGKNTVLGGEGGLLSLPSAPAQPGSVLTISPSNSTFGVDWAPIPVRTVTQGNNIAVNTVGLNTTVSVRNPLNAVLNVGAQNIQGTTGQVLLTSGGSNLTASSSTVTVQDTASPAINTTILKTGIQVNNATDDLNLTPASLQKNTGAGALVIEHNVASGPISLETQGGTADVTTNCALAPAKIRASNGVGAANQLLSASAAGGSLTWVDPAPIPTIQQVLKNGGNVVSPPPAGTFLDMGGNQVKNVAGPSANNDAATKLYVDSLLTTSLAPYGVETITAGPNITLTPAPGNPKQIQISATGDGNITGQAFYVFTIKENGFLPGPVRPVALSGGYKYSNPPPDEPFTGPGYSPHADNAGEPYDYSLPYPQDQFVSTCAVWGAHVGYYPPPVNPPWYENSTFYAWFDFPQPPSGIVPIVSNDPNISFCDQSVYSSNSNNFITYTGTGRVIVTLSSTEVIFTSLVYNDAGPPNDDVRSVTYTNQSIFNQNVDNYYYPSGVTLACGVLPGSTPPNNRPTNPTNSYVQPDLVGTSAPIGPSNIVNTATYQGAFSATFELAPLDSIFLYPIINGYFAYSSFSNTPFRDPAAAAQPAFTYAFRLEDMEIKMHVIRIED